MKKIKLFLIFFALLSALLLYSCDAKCEHQYETSTIAPSCTEDGKTVSVCKSCGDTKESILPATGHGFTPKVTEATCESEGYTEFVCTCGHSYKTDLTSAKGHDYTYVVTSPKCTEAGYTTYSCKKCTFFYVSDVLPPTGHQLITLKSDSSCENEGYTQYSCSICDYSYVSNYVAPLGHDILSVATDPTCTEGGFTTHSCASCDFTYISDYTKPSGHNILTAVTSPKCMEGGYTEYFCSECDFSYRSDFTEPLYHSYCEEIISGFSCTVAGEVKYTCFCGDAYTVITPPSGHTFNEIVTSPTVSDMGYTEYICECGFSYIGNYRFYSEILDNAYAGNDKVLARGIDISKWNHTVNSKGEFEPIDWVALKEAGVDYVILKIGASLREGGDVGGIEPTFEMDYQGAKAAGIDVGVYFFTYSTTVSGIRKDAELLLTYLEGKQFEYPIYLDLEPSENENYHPENIAAPILTEMLLNFFSILQKEGYYTGLYVNNEFLFNILQTDNMIELFEIWYARPPRLDSYVWSATDEDSFVWNTEKYGEHLGMWQYCWTGQLSPIKGDVDFNYSYKYYPDIIKQYGFNGY